MITDIGKRTCSCFGRALRRLLAITGFHLKGRSDYALIDLKEAVEPIGPVAAGADMPADNAERVVAAARALSPALGDRMVAVRAFNRSLFAHELSPQDPKLEVNQFSGKQATWASRYLAYVVGKAHARQMDDAVRREWAGRLNADSHGAIDAPPWLWESVVALAGDHETGYFDHCRRYAFA